MVLLFFLSLMITASQCKVEIVQQPQTQTTCFGSAVQFTCSLNGTNVLPSWVINGSIYSPVNLPPNTFANVDGLMVIAENHNVSYQCYFIDILESGAEQTVVSDVAYLLLNADTIQFQTQQFTLEDPPITALYVSNESLHLHWRKPNIQISITSYNISLESANDSIALSVDGNTFQKVLDLRTTAANTIFKLRIHACLDEMCSVSKMCDNYIVDLNDPGLLQFHHSEFTSSDMEVCINMTNYTRIGDCSRPTAHINSMSYCQSDMNCTSSNNTDSIQCSLNATFIKYRYFDTIRFGQLCITNVTELLMEFPNEMHFSVCAECCFKNGLKKRFQANLTKLPDMSTSISMTLPTITAESMTPVITESSSMPSPTTTGSGWNLKADIRAIIIGLFALYSLHTVYSLL